jgi:hypothetical protein
MTRVIDDTKRATNEKPRENDFSRDAESVSRLKPLPRSVVCSTKHIRRSDFSRDAFLQSARHVRYFCLRMP